MKPERRPRRLRYSAAGLLLALAACAADPSPTDIVAGAPRGLRVPTLAFDANTVVLVWDGPEGNETVVDYRVYRDGAAVSGTRDNQNRFSPAKPYMDRFYAEDAGRFHTAVVAHNFTVDGLTPATTYTFTVRALFADGTESPDSDPVTQTTAPVPIVFDVTDYGARPDGSTVNTRAIQDAIDACTPGGVVRVPAGVYKTGALFLKSRMTLELAAGSTLLGSERAEDYPLGLGYRIYAYAPERRPPSLLNAFDVPGEYNDRRGAFTDIRIVGPGTIDGNGWLRGARPGAPETTADELGRPVPEYRASGESRVREDGRLARDQYEQAVAQGVDSATAYGFRRSSLITLRGVRNVYLGGFTVRNPAFHGIMALESENVAVNGVVHQTYDCNNGDGVEFGNSEGVIVFNNVFDTGDDSVNFAAGYGAGAAGQRPMQNAWIFNNYFRRGHGAVVAGSHTGAWIQDVLAEDNVASGTDVALRCKSNTVNGGGARRLRFRRNAVRRFRRQAYVFTLDYAPPSSTFPPAAVPGRFQEVAVGDTSVEAGASPDDPSLHVYGARREDGLYAFHERIDFERVRFRDVNPALLDGLRNSTFRDVTFDGIRGGGSPWTITANSANLRFEGTTPRPDR